MTMPDSRGDPVNGDAMALWLLLLLLPPPLVPCMAMMDEGGGGGRLYAMVEVAADRRGDVERDE